LSVPEKKYGQWELNKNGRDTIIQSAFTRYITPLPNKTKNAHLLSVPEKKYGQGQGFDESFVSDSSPWCLLRIF